MERISPALIRRSPCSDFKDKFPESSFCAICPSIGFGNRPVSGRRVILTRSPTANIFNEFANDSNIAIAPPKKSSVKLLPRRPTFYTFTLALFRLHFVLFKSTTVLRKGAPAALQLPEVNRLTGSDFSLEFKCSSCSLLTSLAG